MIQAMFDKIVTDYAHYWNELLWLGLAGINFDNINVGLSKTQKRLVNLNQTTFEITQVENPTSLKTMKKTEKKGGNKCRH